MRVDEVDEAEDWEALMNGRREMGDVQCQDCVLQRRSPSLALAKSTSCQPHLDVVLQTSIQPSTTLRQLTEPSRYTLSFRLNGFLLTLLQLRSQHGWTHRTSTCREPPCPCPSSRPLPSMECYHSRRKHVVLGMMPLHFAQKAPYLTRSPVDVPSEEGRTRTFGLQASVGSLSCQQKSR
jgi:hypothetical protein